MNAPFTDEELYAPGSAYPPDDPRSLGFRPHLPPWYFGFGEPPPSETPAEARINEAIACLGWSR